MPSAQRGFTLRQDTAEKQVEVEAQAPPRALLYDCAFAKYAKTRTITPCQEKG